MAPARADRDRLAAREDDGRLGGDEQLLGHFCDMLESSAQRRLLRDQGMYTTSTNTKADGEASKARRLRVLEGCRQNELALRNLQRLEAAAGAAGAEHA